jgi:hypothetical protein
MSPSLENHSLSTRTRVSFCPACWEQIPFEQDVCPRCATNILRYLATTDYGQELINGLAAVDARRRLTAAWLLGEQQEKRAVSALERVIMVEKQDIYLAKAAVTALEKIGGVDAGAAVRLAADHHPARLVRQAAREALQQSFYKR